MALLLRAEFEECVSRPRPVCQQVSCGSIDTDSEVRSTFGIRCGGGSGLLGGRDLRFRIQILWQNIFNPVRRATLSAVMPNDAKPNGTPTELGDPGKRPPLEPALNLRRAPQHMRSFGAFLRVEEWGSGYPSVS